MNSSQQANTIVGFKETFSEITDITWRMKLKRLGIIIPVYNEQDNIGSTLTRVEKHIREPHRIYIVYDMDDDNSLPVAQTYAQQGMDIFFVKNEVGGVVNALKKGLKIATEELLVVMADMSDDLAVVDKMISKMDQGYDLVCGSRYMPGGQQIGGPILKKTLSRLAGLSLKYLTGLPTSDVTNSFKLYRKKIIDSFEPESNGGFEIGMELVIKAHFAGFRVTEAPSIWTDRQEGQSRFRILKWAPNYMKWYLLAIKNSLRNLSGSASQK